MRAVLLLALVVAAAGCADPHPSGSSASGTPTPDATNGATGGPAVKANATLVTTPIQWSGHTKEGAWVCPDQDGIGQCMAGQQVAPDGQFVQTFAYAGDLTRLDVNMTWQPAPGQNGLVLAAYGNTTGGLVLLGYGRGPSPLNLVLNADDLRGVIPDDSLMLMVWPEGKTPTQPSVYVDATQQPFTVAGSLESKVAVAA